MSNRPSTVILGARPECGKHEPSRNDRREGLALLRHSKPVIHGEH